MKTIREKPMYWYLMVLTIAAAAGLQGWRTLFNNFVVEVGGLDGFHVGIVQSIREMPGFLALCAVFLIMIIRENRLSAFSVMCMGAGICLTGFLPTFQGIILTTLLMSFGFHYYQTTNQSLILQNFDEFQSPLVMGSQRSMMSLVCIVVGIGVFILSSYLSYKAMFFIIGFIVVCAGIWGFLNEPECDEKHIQAKKLLFKKKYSLFYFLTMMSGARRQTFMVFSVFLLVKRLGFTVQEITILFVLNNVINYFMAPIVARAIKRFGERTILSIEYASIIVIFTAYAFCPYKWVVGALYMLDHIAFNGAMAIRTYFQKIADPRDISSSTAVSFTINHIAAVILPVLGGYLWMIDFRIPFLGGAVLGVVSLMSAQFVRVLKPAN